MKRFWTEEEKTLLISSWASTCSKEIAKKVNRSPKAVKNKASRLKLYAINRNYSYSRPVKQYSPSSSLAYLIGAIKGDGSVFRYRNFYWITLSAIDFEFVSSVREAIATVVGRKPKIEVIKQHRTSLNPGHKIYRIRLCDKSLFTLLSQPLNRLRSFIDVFPSEFLRGFFDAEGSAWIGKNGQPVVKYCNTNIEILNVVRELLLRLRIYPAPSICKYKGNFPNSKICYFFHITRKHSVKRFMAIVGSSIPRKRLYLNV